MVLPSSDRAWVFAHIRAWEKKPCLRSSEHLVDGVQGDLLAKSGPEGATSKIKTPSLPTIHMETDRGSNFQRKMLQTRTPPTVKLPVNWEGLCHSSQRCKRSPSKWISALPASIRMSENARLKQSDK